MNEEDSNLVQFIEYLVKNIVTAPSDVMIEKNMNSYNETFVIHVASADMGILIGKGGKNINAIRSLVSIKANPVRVYVQIAEQLPE